MILTCISTKRKRTRVRIINIVQFIHRNHNNKKNQPNSIVSLSHFSRVHNRFQMSKIPLISKNKNVTILKI